jgi:hypothetical protein
MAVHPRVPSSSQPPARVPSSTQPLETAFPVKELQHRVALGAPKLLQITVAKFQCRFFII